MHVLRSLAPAALLFSAACASTSPPQGPSPAAPEMPAQAVSSERPEGELDRAERDLDRALATATIGQDDAQPMKKEARDAEALAGGEAEGGDRCSLACRALGSMRRASEHICAMGGDAEARCVAARDRVESAQSRVMTACPSCSS